MKVLIIGGGGYVGSALCRNLLRNGWDVSAFDTFWYGKQVLPHSVRKIEGDMRDLPKLRKALMGVDAVIHLACISNDPSFDLNPDLGRSINLECFPAVCESIRDAKVKRFVYASSSSVYGIQYGNVTETTACNPLTDYSKFKLACEKHLNQMDMDRTVWTILRPATVCGASPRLRLDLVVNALTISALETQQINVYGGKQLRPNVNINDMCNAYSEVLEGNPSTVHRKIYNVGGVNLSVSAIANTVCEVLDVPIEIKEVPSNDLRSYHINSNLIQNELGWTQLHGIKRAIRELEYVYPYLTDPLNNPRYHNIKRMKELNL